MEFIATDFTDFHGRESIMFFASDKNHGWRQAAWLSTEQAGASAAILCSTQSIFAFIFRVNPCNPWQKKSIELHFPQQPLFHLIFKGHGFGK